MPADTPTSDASLPDPRNNYDRPKEILEDATLSEAQKAHLLALWQSELDDRLRAEDEGMGVSDPMHHRDEAQLANEARKVSDAKIALGGDTPQEEVHLDKEEARGGSSEHVVRYVLGISLVLVIIAFIIASGVVSI